MIIIKNNPSVEESTYKSGLSRNACVIVNDQYFRFKFRHSAKLLKKEVIKYH